MKKALAIRLDINGTSFVAPSYQDGNIVIDRRIQNFEEVSSQQGVLTRLPFRVPLDEVLIDALGDLTDLTQDPKVDIRKAITGSIVIDGQDIYNGSFQVIGIFDRPKEIEFIFQGNETALKSRAKDILLKDLFEGETILYTAEEIRDRLVAQTKDTTDYAYGLIDYGQFYTGTGGGGIPLDNVNSPILQRYFKPLVSLQKVLDLLADVEGINITVDTDVEDLTRQYFPLHNNNETSPVLTTQPVDNTGSFNVVASRAIASYNNDQIDQETQITADSFTNYNTVGFDVNSYTVQEDGLHTFNFNVGIQATLTPSTVSQTVNIAVGLAYKINAGALQVIDTRVVQTTTSTKIAFNTTRDLFLQDGQDVTFFVGISQVSVLGVYSIDYSTFQASSIFCVKSPSFTLTSEVVVSENIPEGMNVWDHCIKTIINQCNGIVETTESGYNIKPWNKWIEEGEHWDITDKIVNEQKIKIEPPSTTGAKRIEFKYLEDGDFYNDAFSKQVGQNYGELIIEDTGIDFATNTVKVEIPYAATPIAPVVNYSIPIPKFVDEDFEIVKTKPRLLKFNDLDDAFYTIQVRNNFETNVYTINPTVYLGNWENIDGGFDSKDYNFGQTLNFFASTGFPNNTLYKRFWETYIQETYGITSRRFSVQVVLTQWEAINLTMNEKVFYKGSIYRILRVSGLDLTNPNSPITLELALRDEVEKIDIAPYYPTDVINSIVQWADSSTATALSPADGSGGSAADLEESALAYGFFYDSGENRAVQLGQILVT